MISTIERVFFLKSIDFFRSIPSELLVRVASLAAEQRFDAGTDLMCEGDAGDCVYLVVEGKVAVRHQREELVQLGPRESVGEMSLLDSEPRSASVVALEDTLTLRVDQGPFFSLLAERPELARGLIAVLSRRLRSMVRTTHR